ncbi:DUF4331 domain-containing protein [uncultured Paludibaculum sp.]|uniref:DUF4331 domain-containing protein n=1 Tax=uncultured Paludibaculum sp. TaxID=1765020 RepID=UPI002AAA8ECF|nr:DUF4331 domain-containing protein [uncultured Paludibaculum sp.]
MILRSKPLRMSLAMLMATLTIQQPAMLAASHREAPITALDQKADITDWYTFVSPERPDKVIMILNVDPFLEPSNGPNYFPFDPGILYEMEVDNDHDGVPDVTFQIRFKTEIRSPGVFTGFVGNLAGIPAITALDGPGSEGLNLRQTYTVTMVTKAGSTDLTAGQSVYAVPANVGGKTMPDYNALRAQGTYDLGQGVRVFAGTVADPFYIDLGAFFDSVNLRAAAGGGVLPAMAEGDDQHNYAPNALAGFDVNTIALEVPITMLTSDGKVHAAGDKEAVIGTYGATSRRRVTVLGDSVSESWGQIQRMGNPLINEAIIGTGSKDKFSMDDPINDAQFANFVLDPLAAKILGSIGVPVAPAPRTDLLLLVQYMAPICPGCGADDAGPVADLLRLNTGICPTSFTQQKRLGFLAGDTSGFPNGRRLGDDVLDIALRAVAGILVDGKKYGTPLGDGVNTGTAPLQQSFPFMAPAYNGRDSVHAGPGQPGCAYYASGICPSM